MSHSSVFWNLDHGAVGHPQYFSIRICNSNRVDLARYAVYGLFTIYRFDETLFDYKRVEPGALEG